jgi:hypothetical protein
MSAMSAAIKRWEKFRDRIERKGLTSYESLKPFPYPMKLWFGGGRPTRLFYFTKPAFMDYLGRQSLFPAHWLVVERYSIPTPEAIATLHLLVKGFRRPLIFVGDLKPLDLTVFALLRRGATGFSRTKARPLPVVYAGLDDRWLAISDRFRRHGNVMPESRMSDLEREHVNLLADLAPDLPALVGDRSWDLLKSGHDVMIEMTYNVGGYREGYLEHLIAHLDIMAARANRVTKVPR